MVPLLLQHQANHDRPDNDGYTPLMCVVFKDLGDEEGNNALPEQEDEESSAVSVIKVIAVLVEFGVDVNTQRSSDGMTVLQFARNNHDKDMMGYLLAHGTEPGSLSPQI